MSRAEGVPKREPGAACLDSSQAWFCRDLWLRTAEEAMKEVDANNLPVAKRQVEEVAARDPMMIEARDREKVQFEGGGDEEIQDDGVGNRQGPGIDPDANAGSDYDAMPDEEGGEEVPPAEEVSSGRLSIPNSVFRPARILVNPRCVTTYAGVSHTQLALDLFGDGDGVEGGVGGVGKYVLEDWEGAPESFVCQEQRFVSDLGCGCCGR